MSNNTPLLQLLNDQLERLQALHELQTLELEVLEQRNAPALEELTERKGVLLSNIEHGDKEIAEHPNAEQLKAAKQQPELQEALLAIQTLLELVQEQNSVNGQVVRLTLGRIQTLKQNLQSLHGDTAMTYDEKGHTRSGLSGKGIKA